MATYIQYILSDDSTFLIEVPEAVSKGYEHAALPDSTDLVVKTKQRFDKAMEGVRQQARELRGMLEDLSPDEVEVKFAIKATGTMGLFAIGNLGAETAYEVTIRWKQHSDAKRPSTNP